MTTKIFGSVSTQRSLPIIYPTIKHFNSPSGSAPEAPPSCRRGKVRHSHLAFLRSTSSTYSFPPGTKYPPCLPDNLDFKRIGFVALPQPLPLPPPPSESYPHSDGPVNMASPSPPHPTPLSPPRVLLQRLLLTRTDAPSGSVTTSTISVETIEQIRRHCQTLAGLRRRRLSATPPAAGKPSVNNGETRRSDNEATDPPPEGPASFRDVGDDVIKINNEEEEEAEEESDVLLALSESSPSAAGSVSCDDDQAELKETQSESKQQATVIPSKAAEEDEGVDDGGTSSDESVIQLQVRHFHFRCMLIKDLCCCF